jgi:predicted kinase
MNRKPKCVIVTGRQGSGKTTLAKKLGERLWMPVICRDEIKEGYVSTYGVKHDELPPDTNGKVTDFFFAIVNQYLERHVSVVVEAAFQHKVWRPRMPAIRALASPWIVLCSADDAVTSKRPIQRGLANPDREFYHGDHRVVHYKKTGEILVPADYEAPQFDVPTIQVATDEGYVPSIDAIIEQIKLSET